MTSGNPNACMRTELESGNGKCAALFKERYRINVTRIALAAKIGVSRNALYNWESGRIDPFLNAEAWANALGYDVLLVEREK